MREAIPPLPQYAPMVLCSVKKKHRDNFTFTFTTVSQWFRMYFKQTPWSKILIEKLIVTQLVKNPPPFMEI
jgi:hypothetical protein